VIIYRLVPRFDASCLCRISERFDATTHANNDVNVPTMIVGYICQLLEPDEIFAFDDHFITLNAEAVVQAFRSPLHVVDLVLEARVVAT
jgi:hypothetical protein